MLASPLSHRLANRVGKPLRSGSAQRNEAADFTLCYDPIPLLALPRPGRLRPSLRRVMSPSRGVGYDYAGISQFLRPDFHWQDSRPYGLRAKYAKYAKGAGENDRVTNGLDAVNSVTAAFHFR